MKKRLFFAVKALAFVLIMAIILHQLNYILMPKKYYNQKWSTTTTYKGFYQLENDSVDVVFLGSSHGASAFNPEKLFQDYGITSYNLGCEQQNLLVSYYWLKEALQYQTPKAVVLDALMLFDYNPSDPLNSSESHTRMAIDAMRWGKVKWEAVNDICEIDQDQTLNSYIFKNIRFHDRWNELSQDDFDYKKWESHYELKGFIPLATTCPDADFQPFSDGESNETTEMFDIMEIYLSKIIELCQENNISLILTKTPSDEWSISKYNTVKNYAEEHGLEYWDFNEKNYYEASDFDFTLNMAELHHTNIWGGDKITAYIGERLKEDYGIKESINTEQWISGLNYYYHILIDSDIPYKVGISEWLDILDLKNHVIFFTTYGDVSHLVDDSTKEMLSVAGINFDVKEGQRYIAIVDGDNVIEQTSDKDIVFTGTFSNNKNSQYKVVSGSGETGTESSVIIDGEEYSYKLQGLNIVIYCKSTEQVINSRYY